MKKFLNKIVVSVLAFGLLTTTCTGMSCLAVSDENFNVKQPSEIISNVVGPIENPYTPNAIGERVTKTVLDNGRYIKFSSHDNWYDDRIELSIEKIAKGGTVTVKFIDNHNGDVTYATLSEGESKVFNVTKAKPFTIYMSGDYITEVTAYIRSYDSK